MMKMLLALSGILLVGSAVALAAREASNDADEQDGAKVVTFDKLPAPAQEALKKLSGSAKLEKIVSEDEDGTTIYEGSWLIEGLVQEASVTEHGQIVETEQTIAWDLLPTPVQETALKTFSKDAQLKVEMKTVTLYEVAAEVGGKEKEILIAPTGQRIEIDREESGQKDGDD